MLAAIAALNAPLCQERQHIRSRTEGRPSARGGDEPRAAIVAEGADPAAAPPRAWSRRSPWSGDPGSPRRRTPDHGSPARPGAGGSCSRRRCPSVTLSRRRDQSLGRGSGSPLRDRAGERGGREQQRRHGDPSCDCLNLRLRSRAGDHPARRRPPLFSTRPTHVRARESIAVRPTAPVRSHSRGSLRPRARRAAALPPPGRCPSLERPGRRSPACPPAATRRRRGPRRGRA